MGLKRFDMLGLAETFHQKDEEVGVAGCVCGMVGIEKVVGVLAAVWECW